MFIATAKLSSKVTEIIGLIELNLKCSLSSKNVILKMKM